jgi:RHS repeat-associated protein
MTRCINTRFRSPASIFSGFAALIFASLSPIGLASTVSQTEPPSGPTILSPAPTGMTEPSPESVPAAAEMLSWLENFLKGDAHGVPVDSSTRKNSTVFAPSFLRIEQDDPDWAVVGTWSTTNLARASGASYQRSTTTGDTAQITFTGTWVSLGFIADRFSGEVEIRIDGVSQGIFDLYRREDTPLSLHFDGLSNAVHSIGLTVSGSANPFAASTRVQLDYADYGDGSLLPDGDFEENDPRLLLSNGWTTVAYAGASGGNYIRATNATVWFPFAGDSFSLHALAYSTAGRAKLFVDGVYLDTIDLFEPVSFTIAEPRILSYEGLGAGDHVLQVLTYQDTTTIDKLTTPGAAPFVDPDPPVSGVTRFEADHPSILYNGVPYTVTANSWSILSGFSGSRASAGEYIQSAAAGDTVSFTFESDWLGIGFITDRFGGRAEIAIDGVTLETIDLYSRFNDNTSRYFRDLGPGPHTATITVLGTGHPNSSGTRVFFDFFDVWDGQPLVDGVFEENDVRLFYSRAWGQSQDPTASGGAYAVSGVSATAWFPFSGDSVTWQGWTRFNRQDVEIRIDGISIGLEDLYGRDEGPRSYSFDGLGDGPHVLELRQYRNDTITVDAFTSPAIGPSQPPPAAPAIVRHEEDHPAMRYNGDPWRSMAQSWSEQGGNLQVSHGYYLTNSSPGDRWRLDFDGIWVNLGFRSTATSGSVEVFIDGVSQGVFATAGGVNDVIHLPFGGLAPGPHSVEVVVATGPVMPDYIDVWNGQAITDGWYDAQLENETSGLIHLSRKQWWLYGEDTYANNGDFLTPFTNANTNIWFTFTGTDLTVLGYQRANASLQVVIDGVDRGVFDLSPPAPFRQQPLALHFNGLAEGAHVVQIAASAPAGAGTRIDAFNVNPPDFASATPIVEWFDTSSDDVLPGGPGTGFASSVAVGDLNGDGVVELVAPAYNGRLYVYRGDGQDAGSGSPIQWTSDLVGPAAEPALADLDGDGNAEIIVIGREGTFAFRHDGQLLWSNTAVRSYFAGESFGWGGPSVANLDLDPEPEIVISALGDALYVLDHEGNTLFSDPLAGGFPTVPVLADITNDGVLDIVVAENWTLKVIDYFNGGTVVWERELPDPINILGGAGSFGGPAIADLDGDGRPEIIMNWGHVIEALQDDGSVLWRYPTNRTDLFRPSGVTVADVTGDGQVNIVTASAISSGLSIFNHLLMVLDAGGSLVWEQTVADNTASASGVAAQDLTGNGAWEIIWNGAIDGFLIFNGADGKRLYNEPYTGSGTVLDYPTLADVDGDGEAEVIVAGRNGLFVIGHPGRWVDSRPVWNQHNYHINNINNDWSVPFTEENSWELHNSYRTQTPDRDPGCLLDNGVPVPPRFVELSPGSRTVLPSGVPLVISGRVLPVGFQQSVLDVQINGVPVDVLDPSGSFFAVIELAPGPNPIELRATDRCAEGVLAFELNGGGNDDDPWADLADASVLFEARFSATTHDPASERLLTRVQAFNAGPSVPGPVLMTVGGDADPSIGLLNADGFTPQGEPYVVVVPEGDVLAAGGLSVVRDIALANPQRAPIDFTPRWIAPVNQPPYFSSIPNPRAVVGQAWRYPIEVADGNNDPITLSLPTAPAGMAVVDAELVWTPAAVGNFDVVVLAADGRSGVARQGFTLQVSDSSFNSPPVFTSTPAVQIAIGGNYRYAARASDLDGDALTYSLQAAPAGVLVDAGSGLVSWPRALSGQHSLVLVADDARGGQTSQAWTLYVGEPAATEPGPAFSSVPVSFAAVGVQYRYAFRVNSFQSDTPTVSLLQTPAGMSLDPVGKVLTWVPVGADLGTHVIELRAVDSSGLAATQRYDLQVLPELPNQPPYFVSAPPLNARSGSPYSYPAAAIDPEFEALTWSLTTAPAGMSVDPLSGLVSWVPATAVPAQVSVLLQAADPAGAVAVQQFFIQLRDTNVAPAITTSPPTSALVGEFYSVRMLANDADGDPLIWRLLDGPTGMTLHPSLGWLHWTTAGVAPGSYLVTIEVADDWGGRDELAFTIDLQADVEPPEVTITMLPALACRAEPATVCVEASDNVGLTSVTLEIDGQPRALNSSRCHLWTPAEAGLIPALAEAIDPSGQSAQASSTLTVADCNDEQAPVVTLISPLPGSTHDAPVPIVVSIDDNTPAVLTWDVTLRRKGSDDDVVLASGSGAVADAEVAVFDPLVLQAGDYEVDIVANDGAQTGGLRVPLASGTGQKPGRVAFTQQDLAWRLGAFPLVIGRSYDSLDASQFGGDSGDLGPGWRLALSAAVEDSATDAPAGGFLLGGEAFNSQTRVIVTKPNGERAGFTFEPKPKAFPAAFQFDVVYTPDPGVTDTLRAVGWPDTVFQLGAGFANYIIPYNPSVYELETQEGVVFQISETGGLLEVRDPQGGVVTAEPDGWQSSWGARVTYLRNAEGRITDIVMIDGDGVTELGRILYGYDGIGNLVSVTDLGGGAPTFEYTDPDHPHHVTGLFDALGRPLARMVFDDEGRQIAHCQGDADPVTLVGCSLFDFGTDATSQTIFDGRGFQSELYFDNRGLLVLRRDEIETSVWVEQSWQYDDQGREIERVDADAGVTSTQWDDNGNRIRLEEPDGRFWTWTWGDCSGKDEWLQRCDALGNCTQQQLDAACRVVRTIDPLEGEIVFVYNANGQRTAIIDAVGERVENAFDARGQLTRFTDALGGELVNEFGGFGELTAEIERNGVRRDWSYDDGVRVETETWTGAGVGASGISWSNDVANLIDGQTWPGADLSYSYWPSGKVRRVTHSSATAPDWWIEYGYDANDNINRLEDSFGGVTEYQYDGLNEVTEIRQSGPGVLTKRVVIDNSNTGQPVQVRRYASLDDSQPGPVTDFQYGCLSCPTTLSQITHRRADTGLIHDRVYQRNALHQIVGLTDPLGTHAFVFDGRGWLIEADHPAGFAGADQAFEWDAAGNWLTRNGDFSGATSAVLGYAQGQGGHRLLSDGVNGYQYDARGSLSERSGPNRRLVIERDGRGNAVAITEFDASNQVLSTASYVYSSAQQRVRAERDGVVRHYVFDGPNPIIALDDSGQVVWRQLHSRSIDRPLAMELGGQRIWLLHDHLGSVVEQVDDAGLVLNTFSYDAFGRQLSGPAPTLDDPVRFTGREFDLPGGLGYYRQRLYDPAIGRFLSSDPLEPWHYRYADNNPVGYVDPSGAVSALEYALMSCDNVASLISPGGGSEQAAVIAAFSGDIRGLLFALAGSLASNVLPCGSDVFIGD